LQPGGADGGTGQNQQLKFNIFFFFFNVLKNCLVGIPFASIGLEITPSIDHLVG